MSSKPGSTIAVTEPHTAYCSVKEPWKVERRKWNPWPPGWATFLLKEYIGPIMAAPLAGVIIRASLFFRALLGSYCRREMRGIGLGDERLDNLARLGYERWDTRGMKCNLKIVECRTKSRISESQTRGKEWVKHITILIFIVLTGRFIWNHFVKQGSCAQKSDYSCDRWYCSGHNPIEHRRWIHPRPDHDNGPRFFGIILPGGSWK